MRGGTTLSSVTQVNRDWPRNSTKTNDLGTIESDSPLLRKVEQRGPRIADSERRACTRRKITCKYV